MNPVDEEAFLLDRLSFLLKACCSLGGRKGARLMFGLFKTTLMGFGVEGHSVSSTLTFGSLKVFSLDCPWIPKQ